MGIANEKTKDMKRDRSKIANKLAKQERTSSYTNQIAQIFCLATLYYYLHYLLAKKVYKKEVFSF